VVADGRWLAGAQDRGDVLVWDFEHPDQPPTQIARATTTGSAPS
jgi:hypothetical protein